MLQCTCCGSCCTAPSYFWQDQGECFGFPAYEELAGCPVCGGSLELREDDEDLWEVDADDRYALED